MEHSRQLKGESEPLIAEYVPAMHDTHESDDEALCDTEYVPALQLIQTFHDVALTAVE